MIAHAGGADESLGLVLMAAALWTAWAARSRLKGLRFERIPRGAALGMLAAAGALVVASAWLPRALLGPGAPSRTFSAPRPTPLASLKLVSPTEGASVTGERLRVVMELEGGRVVSDETLVTGDTGHIHVAVDGKMVSMTYGPVQEISLTPYGPGEHILEAEFVAADHLPFDPPVVARATFVVQEAR
jgi:hypothetical protein